MDQQIGGYRADGRHRAGRNTPGPGGRTGDLEAPDRPPTADRGPHSYDCMIAYHLPRWLTRHLEILGTTSSSSRSSRAQDASATASTPRRSAPGSAPIGPGAQAFHRGLKAEGGFAVVHTEWCAIHPEADEWPAITGRLWDDDDLRNLSLMVDRVHEHGALAGVQLGFNGNHTENLETRGGRARRHAGAEQHVRLSLLLRDDEGRDPRAPGLLRGLPPGALETSGST